MSIELLKDQLPDYAKDIKLNLSNVMLSDGMSDLSQAQIFMIAIACAYTLKSPTLTDAINVEVGNQLNDIEKNAAKSAASIMAMNNIYYRFIHLVSDKSFSTMPAKLRMNVINSSGIEKSDFELCSLAVSALNGCGMCIDAHTHELIKAGISKLAIQSTVRIAAVLNSVAIILA